MMFTNNLSIKRNTEVISATDSQEKEQEFAIDHNNEASVKIPSNKITLDTKRITPDLLPLIDLSQEEIDIVVSRVEGGVSNIQDIYPLSSVQDAFLFCHRKSERRDPYLSSTRIVFDSREIFNRFIECVYKVAYRNDIIRSAVIWEGISKPAQVVLREFTIPITEHRLNPVNGSIPDQLSALSDVNRFTIDLAHAPWVHYVIAEDTDGRIIVDEIAHHIMGDAISFTVVRLEIKALMNGMGSMLPEPQQYRDYIAEAKTSPNIQSHQDFFTNMLSSIESPTSPYGFTGPHGEDTKTNHCYLMLPKDIDAKLVLQAERINVSIARICHLAWGLVLSKLSGEEQVVFGTVLSLRRNFKSASNAIGPFINTLPFRVDINGIGLIDALYQVKDNVGALIEHGDTSLAEAQRCSGCEASNGLLTTILNVRKSSSAMLNLVDTPRGMSEEVRVDKTPEAFVLTVEQGGDTLGLSATVIEPYEASRFCRYMKQALESLVHALEDNPNIPVNELQVIPPEELRQLISMRNSRKATHMATCYHQVFERQALLTPDSIALVHEDQTMTYRELNICSNRLAHHLIKLGVKPETIIAICARRSIAMIVSILAVMKAGGAYVPMDPIYASERLNDILADASPFLIIADEVGVSVLKPTVTVVDPNIHYDEPIYNPVIEGLTQDNLAYIIYTSGSTGKPKGVMMEHKNLVSVIEPRASVFKIRPSSRVLQFFSMSFDASVHEFVSALSFGGSLHILPEAARMDRSMLWEYINTHSITDVILTPSLIQDCKGLPKILSPLNMVLCGEPLTAALVKEVQELIPNGTIFNDYGPTEAAVDTLAWQSPKGFNEDTVPLGLPHANKRVYILDNNQLLVPLGVTGELYIAGNSVGRGYLNRPELNEKCFITDPFSNDPDSRMYKTGDLVRYLPDGNIIYAGRCDRQIKIRGFRVELGEIEARISEHPLVKDAVVVAHGEGMDKRLVSYIVADPRDDLALKIQSYLKPKLPDYMIPAAFVRLDSFKLNHNGKVDLKALPEPETSAFASREYVAPQGEIESAMASIWSKLLRVTTIGRHDNFFSIGGHSLLAIKMIKEVQTNLGLEIKLQDLFEAPSIAELVPRAKKTWENTDSSFGVMLPLKTKGNRPPLFCIHSAAGLSWSYNRMAPYLHPEQPLYGLQARGIDGRGNLAKSVEEMASDYIEQIRLVQPFGPYHLLGWSFGGNVAHCIATQLQSLGHEVSLLVLLDSTLDIITLVTTMKDDLKEIFFREFVGKGSEEEGMIIWERVQESVQNSILIVVEHQPTVFKGDMIYFSATKTEEVVEHSGWTPLVDGKIEVLDVQCKHTEMDQVQHMETIGKVVGKRLDDMHVKRRVLQMHRL